MRWLCIPLAVACVGCTKAADPLPVPEIGRSVKLGVGVVSNPALPDIERARVDRILAEAALEARATFGVEIEFAVRESVDIARFFERFAPDFVRRARKELIYDFKRGTGDEAKLAAALEDTFKKSGGEFDVLYRYAQPYLLRPPQTRDLRGLAKAAAYTHVVRLGQLKDVGSKDGRRAITDAPYNEYVFWQAAGRYPLALEVIITNQLVASAEYLYPDLHSALRGGVTLGITSECADCAFGTYSMLSVYAVWSDDPAFRDLRDATSLSEKESVRAAALVLVHELGHQLFHYGHPFGQTACVMSPTPVLRFGEWTRRVEPKGCAFGSQPTLQPGFYKFADQRKYHEQRRAEPEPGR